MADLQLYDRDAHVIELQAKVREIELSLVELEKTVSNQANLVRLVLARTLSRLAEELDSSRFNEGSDTDRTEAQKENLGKKDNSSIRPDEFFGMTHAEAARKYLRGIGHAIALDELVTALRAGGCRLSGDNPKKVLYMSLIRNTHDFRAPQRGYIGLSEFYERSKGR